MNKNKEAKNKEAKKEEAKNKRDRDKYNNMTDEERQKYKNHKKEI